MIHNLPVPHQVSFQISSLKHQFVTRILPLTDYSIFLVMNDGEYFVFDVTDHNKPILKINGFLEPGMIQPCKGVADLLQLSHDKLVFFDKKNFLLRALNFKTGQLDPQFCFSLPTSSMIGMGQIDQNDPQTKELLEEYLDQCTSMVCLFESQTIVILEQKLQINQTMQNIISVFKYKPNKYNDLKPIFQTIYNFDSYPCHLSFINESYIAVFYSSFKQDESVELFVWNTAYQNGFTRFICSQAKFNTQVINITQMGKNKLCLWMNEPGTTHGQACIAKYQPLTEAKNQDVQYIVLKKNNIQLGYECWNYSGMLYFNYKKGVSVIISSCYTPQLTNEFVVLDVRTLKEKYKISTYDINKIVFAVDGSIFASYRKLCDSADAMKYYKENKFQGNCILVDLFYIMSANACLLQIMEHAGIAGRKQEVDQDEVLIDQYCGHYALQTISDVVSLLNLNQ